MSIRSDYKPPANWRPQRQSVRRHGLLVVTLTLIGLFGSALAYIKQHNSQQQTSATPPAATPAAQPPSRPSPRRRRPWWRRKPKSKRPLPRSNPNTIFTTNSPSAKSMFGAITPSHRLSPLARPPRNPDLNRRPNRALKKSRPPHQILAQPTRRKAKRPPRKKAK